MNNYLQSYDKDDDEYDNDIQELDKYSYNKYSTYGQKNYNSKYFGKMKLFKRLEIVSPEPYFEDIETFKNNLYNYFQHSTTLRSDQKADIQRFFPKHLISDIYSLYYNDSSKLKFEKLDESNSVKFSILKKVNSYLSKVITNNSYISSYVFLEKICEYLYLNVFDKLSKEEKKELVNNLNNTNPKSKNKPKPKSKSQPKSQPPQSKNNQKNDDNSDSDDNEGSDGNDGNSNDNEGNNQQEQGDGKQSKGNDESGDSSAGKGNAPSQIESIPDIQDDVDKSDIENRVEAELDNSLKQLENFLQEARNQCETLEDAGLDSPSLDKSEQRELLNNLGKLGQIRSFFEKLRANKTQLFRVIEKILNKSTNYLSSKTIIESVNIFEADEINQLENMELLHPIFNNIKLLELETIQKKSIGKIDLYIDISGSMCGKIMKNISSLDLAKALALQMKNLGLLNNLYIFNDHVYPKNAESEINIILISTSGGTNIERVIRHSIETKNNCIILTDAEDSVYTYNEKAFFLGIGNAGMFRYFQNDAQQYLQKKQAICYTGKEFVYDSINH